MDLSKLSPFMAEALAPRPSDEEKGLHWDMVVGTDYRKCAKESQALQHTYQLMARLREDMLRELVASEERGADNRKAIWVLENLLRTPPLMERRAREAEQALATRGSRNG